MIQSMGSIHVELRRLGLPARDAAPDAGVPAAGRPDPRHRAGVPDLRRRLPRRRQLGRRVHPDAVRRCGRPTTTRARWPSTTSRCRSTSPTCGRRSSRRAAGQRSRRLDRRRHHDPEGRHRHLRAVRDRRPAGADGGRARHDRRRGRLPRAGHEPGRGVPRQVLQPGDEVVHQRGPAGTTGSQTLDALPLAMGIVPAEAKQSVLDDLEQRIRDYHPGGEPARTCPAARSASSRPTGC